jgi:hypothetical protein
VQGLPCVHACMHAAQAAPFCAACCSTGNPLELEKRVRSCMEEAEELPASTPCDPFAGGGTYQLWLLAVEPPRHNAADGGLPPVRDRLEGPADAARHSVAGSSQDCRRCGGGASERGARGLRGPPACRVQRCRGGGGAQREGAHRHSGMRSMRDARQRKLRSGSVNASRFLPSPLAA